MQRSLFKRLAVAGWAAVSLAANCPPVGPPCTSDGGLASIKIAETLTAPNGYLDLQAPTNGITITLPAGSVCQSSNHGDCATPIGQSPGFNAPNGAGSGYPDPSAPAGAFCVQYLSAQGILNKTTCAPNLPTVTGPNGNEYGGTLNNPGGIIRFVLNEKTQGDFVASITFDVSFFYPECTATTPAPNVDATVATCGGLQCGNGGCCLADTCKDGCCFNGTGALGHGAACCCDCDCRSGDCLADVLTCD